MYFSRSRRRSFAQEMLAQIELTEDVDDFLRHEKVASLISSAYLKLKPKVEKLIQRLPDSKKETVIDVEGLEALFTKEVKYDFEKSLALSLRCSYSRGEINDEFLELCRTELKSFNGEAWRRLGRSLQDVEASLIGHCEMIVDMHSHKFSYHDEDDDDSNEVEVYD